RETGPPGLNASSPVRSWDCPRIPFRPPPVPCRAFGNAPGWPRPIQILPPFQYPLYHYMFVYTKFKTKSFLQQALLLRLRLGVGFDGQGLDLVTGGLFRQA